MVPSSKFVTICPTSSSKYRSSFPGKRLKNLLV